MNQTRVGLFQQPGARPSLTPHAPRNETVGLGEVQGAGGCGCWKAELSFARILRSQASGIRTHLTQTHSTLPRQNPNWGHFGNNMSFCPAPRPPLATATWAVTRKSHSLSEPLRDLVYKTEIKIPATLPSKATSDHRDDLWEISCKCKHSKHSHRILPLITLMLMFNFLNA